VTDRIEPGDGGLRRWERAREGDVQDFRIFRVRRIAARSPRTGQVRPFTILECPEWVNVVAITVEGRVILIRQFRHGTGEVTLEIPGGVVEAGETPAAAAARELREETGYAGGEPRLLGVVEPNPAIQSNRCHLFLIEGCARVGDLALDAGEDIAVLTAAVDEVLAAVDDGRIRHALVLCALSKWRARGP
jgi:8-oxo-dGTP pyrophosphatase MutT (NUDIX family)